MTRNLKILLIVLMLVSVLFACKSMKPVTKENYNKDGLSFTHLSNWEITEDSIIEEAVKARLVQIEGPNDAIIFITRFPIEAEITLESYAELMDKERTDIMKKKLGGVITVGNTVTKAHQRQIGGKSLKGLLQEFTMKLLGVDVPHRSEFFMVQDDKHKWLIATQVSVEDAGKTQEGFQTIYDTLSFAL